MEQPCQTCGSRPARNFVCQIIHGQQTNRILCDACLRNQSLTLDWPMLDGTQTCFYCGGIASSVSTNQSWELAVRQKRFHYTCCRCAELVHQFTMEALSPLLDQAPPKQQEQMMQDMIRLVDERVRRVIQEDAS